GMIYPNLLFSPKVLISGVDGFWNRTRGRVAQRSRNWVRPKASDESLMKKNTRGGRSMISRLVLVGVVAALGVALPSRSECEGWFTLVQGWGSALLADWDTAEARRDDAYCAAETPIAAGSEPSLGLGATRVVSGEPRESAQVRSDGSSAARPKELGLALP